MKQIILALLFLQSIITVKIFFIGGASNQNSTLIFSQLAKVIPGRLPQPKKCDNDWDKTNCPRIAVVTSAAQSQADGNDAYSNDTQSISYKTLFDNYGLTSKHISVHIDNYLKTTNISTKQGLINLQIIKQADIVYFNGGDQSRHIRSWLNDNATPNQLFDVLSQRIIKNQVVCAGTSAGSMIWANQTFGQGSSFGILHYSTSIGLAPKKISDGGINGTGLSDLRNGTKSLQYSYNGGKMTSFGFVDFLTDTHFNARGRFGRIVPVLIDLNMKFGIGIDQNTSLYYDNGLGKVYGWNGVTFVDINYAIFDKKAPFFAIKNVTANYLTQGDQYDFISKRVISSKPLIDSPYYNSPTDSNDILAAYEATLLETRLIDQKPTYNLGKVKVPSAFPRSTPIYQIKFLRTQGSKGYFSNKKYTVENIVGQFSYETNNLIAEQ